jgi:thioredoxin 1
MATIALTEQNFEETVLSEGITIVDFWADWCGPCKSFAPVFEKTSGVHTDVRFAKVDTEAEQGLAAALQIRSIPTIMVFRDGILLFNQAGAMPEAALEQIVTGAKALDMDEIRREIAEEEKSAAQNASEAE